MNYKYMKSRLLDTLPFRESRSQYLTRVYGNMYDIERFDHPWIRTIGVDKLVYRVLFNNINKSFDKAFSYFCRNVSKEFQYKFLVEFERYYHWMDKQEWEVVDGLINHNPFKYKKYSPTKDYKYYRTKAEELKAERKQKRENKLALKNKEYNFFTQEEILTKKLKYGTLSKN